MISRRHSALRGSSVFFTLTLLAASLGTAASAEAADKTLVYCTEGSPSTMNAQLAEDASTGNVINQMFNSLLQFKFGTTTVEPALAESWTISKDALTYTFKLRKGVKFHKTKYFTPTRDFNADDVLFSLNRARLKDHPLHSLPGVAYAYWESMEMNTLIKDVVKVDDHTVKIILSRKEAPFLANLAMPMLAPVTSAEYGQKLVQDGKPEKFDWEPIGTGPFKFVRYDKDQMVRMEAHESYFRGRPKLDRIVFSITTDASVRTQKLKAGECHLVYDPAAADFDSIRSDGNLKIIEAQGMNVAYLGMNVRKKPFDNALVRQAVNHALNRKSYIDAIYLGNAVVAKNPIPPMIWSYDNSIKDYDYNPEKAKALLAKAGLPNGFETEMWTMPVSRPYNPNGKKMGEMMQADLAKVGIRVKLISYDWPTYLKKARQGDQVMIQMGWNGDNGDPDNFMNVLLSCASTKSGQNVSFWCDPEFDRLVTQARETPDQKKRTELYKKAQAVFKKEAPWVPLAHSKVFRAHSKKLKNYKFSAFTNWDHFEKVDLE